MAIFSGSGKRGTKQSCLLRTTSARQHVSATVFIVFSPRPGRIQEEFTVDLPRPRDINSVDLAIYSTKITKALKSDGQPELNSCKMKRFLLAALFFAVLILFGRCVSCKDLVACLSCRPRPSRSLSGRRCHATELWRRKRRITTQVAHWLHHWISCRTALGLMTARWEAMAGYDRHIGPRSTRIAECLLGATRVIMVWTVRSRHAFRSGNGHAVVGSHRDRNWRAPCSAHLSPCRINDGLEKIAHMVQSDFACRSSVYR